MTELSRSLIAAAREGLAPDAAIAARVRAKVAAAVGATAATGAAVAIPAKAGSASLLIKLGAALLAVGVVATVVVVAKPGRTAESPRITVVPRENDEVRTDIRVVASADKTSAPQVAPAQHVAPTAPSHATSSVEAAAAEADAVVPSPSPAPARASRTRHDADTGEGASLAREVELIDLAMTSLKKRAPHAALEAIKAYERETHGRGQMAEDAAAIAIEARCNMNLDATAAIESFDAKWPESAQRERIQTACFAKQ